MEKICIKSLSFTYPRQAQSALCDVSLSVAAGEFVVLCGPSGCGKTTLLRQLKPAVAPHGQLAGEILLDGTPLQALSLREQSARIGFVRQNPDAQIVTDKVWHELAFGLESLGMDTPTIRRRVAEMASFFGMQTWYHRSTAELSGGQKQLLNLAAVMVLQPDVLILDEPTSQLDPIAAADFLATLGKINRELGTTILLSEHRLEEAFPRADRVAVMDGGRLLCVDTPARVGEFLRQQHHGMFAAMPTAMRIWAACGEDAPCPVTVRDGRELLGRRTEFLPLSAESIPPCGETVVSAEDVRFRYTQDSPDVLHGFHLTVGKGEFYAIVGGNGTGKTTALKLLSGQLTPKQGEIRTGGRICALPQDPQLLFVKKTLREDLLGQSQDTEQVANIVSLCRLGQLLDRHPYDLSGGEQQRAALAKLLLTKPDILLLDEPTKGLDAEFKRTLGELLKTLLSQGLTIVMVSHDIEFCARYAHRCGLFFDGGIVTEGTPRPFFAGNRYYTTAANRMAQGFVENAVTAEDVIAACGGTVTQTALPEAESQLPPPEIGTADWKPRPLPLWRKLIAALCLLGALAVMVLAVGHTELSQLVTENGLADGAAIALWQYALCIVLLAGFAAATFRRQPAVGVMPRQKLTKRTVAACGMILLCIPLTLFAGLYWLENRHYYLIMTLVMAECILPFLLIFEGRRPQARELVLLAVVCALGVAARSIFFMLPQFKPVVAMTIIIGVALGGESGFLVGAVTMLVSNMFFGQGPWTPWQMFAMGIIGFLAGVLFRRGLLRRSRLSLCIYGVFATIVIYGGIMNPASALTWSQELNWKILLSYYVTGFPLDCVHAGATALFLWFAAEPMLEKLDRIKVKYGLIE